ncbi:MULTISPECIES: DUF6602 domain-containing protein [Burkholderiaceae]|uniref:DUF6602 domain-containing protein n=1 Tax=Burkholderiaceae TaxID=119060 RepID=UPI0005AAE79E|nr:MULTISPECIES: DUF6602 domain-containing protein [Burkholderiaceae]KUY76561.1 hypothetical protein WI25_07075 [Burkholderia cepacia]KVA55380.1 hypothetical protein WI47_06475 [Burkholderia cepacia]KVC13495.1 hypothetical protein WI70_23190 [Burkholderia cepacia]
MNTKNLFQKIGEKMRVDFEAAAEIEHNGSRGTVRENILKKFLSEGRLPPKYGLGAGEIVGRARDTSRQCDLIVYDKFNGVALIYDESTQVYPIDCVYGIIEVKSALSKAEFIDALEKVKHFKAMAPRGNVSQSLGNAWVMTRERPKPFGVIFAYALGKNSLDSLIENLREWESNTPPSLWPNYVCVLGQGVIYHNGQPFEDCLHSDQITSACYPSSMPYGPDSLFKFYCAVHDMCTHMQLGPVELLRYFDPAIQIGKYVVYGRGVEVEITKDGSDPRPARLKESTVAKIVEWCAGREKISYGDILLKRIGSLPVGMDENSPTMKRKVFFYNPDNLKGLGELRDALQSGGEPPDLGRTLIHTFDFIIDEECYVVAGLSHEDFEFEESK